WWGKYPFEMEFRPLALLDIIPIIVNLVVIFLINQPEYRSTTTAWLTMTLATVQLWAVSEAFQHMATTVESYYFWINVEDHGSIFLPMMLYLFVHQYVANALVPIKQMSTLFVGSLTILFI